MLTINKGLVREEVDVHLLDPNPMNPNKMGARAFDLLVQNMEKVGFTDPVLVRPEAGGRFRIVGGHHRVEAAKYLGYDTVPVTVIMDPNFTEEDEEMQLLRHNTIRGQLDPQKFVELYHKYAGKYGDDTLQEMMGFADEAEFQKLVKQTAQALPKELKKKFEEAAKEIKTVEGLAKLLNTLFTKYGDTLPYGYMVFDYASQQNVWIRVSSKTMNAFEVISTICVENSRTVDDLIGALVQSIAKGEQPELVKALIKASPKVELPGVLQTAPTKDNIAAVLAV